MKMSETITSQQKIDMLINNQIVGLFKNLLVDTDQFYDLNYPLCVGYYTVRSANKTVAPVFEELVEYAKTVESEFSEYELANSILGSNIIRPKFIDKWNRVYELLISKQYDALKDFEHTEEHSGNNSDTTTYDSTVENNGETGTKETTVTNRENSDDVYGFNSSSPVGESLNTELLNETTTGNAEDNTTHNKQVKTGTDTKVFTISENLTKSGRNISGADLIEAELDLRNRQLFFDIIYRDIDSIATISVY